MKLRFVLVPAFVFSLCIFSVRAQTATKPQSSTRAQTTTRPQAAAKSQTAPRASVPSNTAVDGAFAKLFGNNSAFTTRADVRIFNGKATSEAFRIPVTISFLSDSMRVDANVMQFRGSGFSPEVAAQLQRLGLDTLICFLKLNGTKVQMAYPSVKSLLEVPIPSDALAALRSKARVDAVPLARETFGKHLCTKNKVTVTGNDGVPHVFMVWNSQDQNNFPARIDTTDNGQRFVIDFSDVKLVKPDVRLFALPSGYRRYTDVGEFQQAMVKRALLGR
jgi:hypothetical protein